MKYWQQFQQFDYADEVMLVVGALLVFVGALQIVRSSLKLLFWVLIAGLGAVSATYGMRQSSYELPSLDSTTIDGARLSDIVDGKNQDVLEYLCQKLEASDAR